MGKSLALGTTSGGSEVSDDASSRRVSVSMTRLVLESYRGGGNHGVRLTQVNLKPCKHRGETLKVNYRWLDMFVARMFNRSI